MAALIALRVSDAEPHQAIHAHRRGLAQFMRSHHNAPLTAMRVADGGPGRQFPHRY
jgi:hypothetical protein